MPTKIEWATEVWNPVTGCTAVSSGCANCYARRMAHRLIGRYGYPADDPFKVTLHPDRLGEPLRWRKPRRVFVCSMGDLFHKDVPWSFIRDVFEVMRIARQHTFLVLTKRPYRIGNLARPLPNVWLGASIEDQPTLEERVRDLLQTPAAVHFLSYEPALGPLDFEATSSGQILGECDHCGHRGNNPECEACDGMASLNWVICGGESGPGARPAHVDWFRSVRDQCQDAGVPFFFKQWGEWLGADDALAGEGWESIDYYGQNFLMPGPPFAVVQRVGKKLAGRLLDGREWNEYPEV